MGANSAPSVPGIRVLIGQHIALNRLEPHEVSPRRLVEPLVATLIQLCAGLWFVHLAFCLFVVCSVLTRKLGLPSQSAVRPPSPSYCRSCRTDAAVAVICTKTNVHQIAREAIENASWVCEEHFGLFKPPPVQLVCPKDLNFMYVPSHLVSFPAFGVACQKPSLNLSNATQNHMLFEILKNSLRAVVETHGVDCEDYPPVKVIVAESVLLGYLAGLLLETFARRGNEDITIKISDQGGGIPRTAVPLVWTFMCVPLTFPAEKDRTSAHWNRSHFRYTTASPENLDSNLHSLDVRSPMAGLGYGLRSLAPLLNPDAVC